MMHDSQTVVTLSDDCDCPAKSGLYGGIISVSKAQLVPLGFQKLSPHRVFKHRIIWHLGDLEICMTPKTIVSFKRVKNEQ